jgi:hypothetical protein
MTAPQRRSGAQRVIDREEFANGGLSVADAHGTIDIGARRTAAHLISFDGIPDAAGLLGLKMLGSKSSSTRLRTGRTRLSHPTLTPKREPLISNQRLAAGLRLLGPENYPKKTAT